MRLLDTYRFTGRYTTPSTTNELSPIRPLGANSFGANSDYFWIRAEEITLVAMSRPEEYFLVFANSDYTLDLSRFIRTETADGWHFFQGKENIGLMLIIKTGDMHYVHASFTRELEAQKITSYIRSLLWSLGVHNALVTIHSGKQVAHFDYEL